MAAWIRIELVCNIALVDVVGVRYFCYVVSRMLLIYCSNFVQMFFGMVVWVLLSALVSEDRVLGNLFNNACRISPGQY